MKEDPALTYGHALELGYIPLFNDFGEQVRSKGKSLFRLEGKNVWITVTRKESKMAKKAMKEEPVSRQEVARIAQIATKDILGERFWNRVLKAVVGFVITILGLCAYGAYIEVRADIMTNRATKQAAIEQKASDTFQAWSTLKRGESVTREQFELLKEADALDAQVFYFK